MLIHVIYDLDAYPGYGFNERTFASFAQIVSTVLMMERKGIAIPDWLPITQMRGRSKNM